MNLLFAIDDNFVQQLETVLLSIHLNTKSQEFNIYVLQKNRLTKEAELAALAKIDPDRAARAQVDQIKQVLQITQ